MDTVREVLNWSKRRVADVWNRAIIPAVKSGIRNAIEHPVDAALTVSKIALVNALTVLAIAAARYLDAAVR